MPGQKGLIPLIFLLGIPIIVSIAIGVYFLGIRSKQQSAQPSTQTFSATPTAISSPKSDPTADWETYTDSLLGFSIKYPNTITVSDLPNRTMIGEVVEFGLKSEESAAKKILENNPYAQDLAFTVGLSVVKRGGKSVLNALQSECPTPCKENTRDVSINNAKGITTLGPNYPYPNENYYFMGSANQVVRVYITKTASTKDSNLKQFKEMIHTFKFIR